MAEGYINQTEGSGKKARTWQSTIGGSKRKPWHPYSSWVRALN